MSAKVWCTGLLFLHTLSTINNCTKLSPSLYRQACNEVPHFGTYIVLFCELHRMHKRREVRIVMISWERSDSKKDSALPLPMSSTLAATSRTSKGNLWKLFFFIPFPFLLGRWNWLSYLDGTDVCNFSGSADQKDPCVPSGPVALGSRISAGVSWHWLFQLTNSYKLDHLVTRILAWPALRYLYSFVGQRNLITKLWLIFPKVQLCWGRAFGPTYDNDWSCIIKHAPWDDKIILKLEGNRW